MLTRKALRLMYTNHLAALGTSPPFLFFSYKPSYAELHNIIEIIDHTHTILSSIAIIQMIQLCARKAVTTEAVLGITFRYFLTVLNFAVRAGL